jgi:hypothetical protein
VISWRRIWVRTCAPPRSSGRPAPTPLRLPDDPTMPRDHVLDAARYRDGIPTTALPSLCAAVPDTPSNSPQVARSRLAPWCWYPPLGHEEGACHALTPPGTRPPPAERRASVHAPGSLHPGLEIGEQGPRRPVELRWGSPVISAADRGEVAAGRVALPTAG